MTMVEQLQKELAVIADPAADYDILCHKNNYDIKLVTGRAVKIAFEGKELWIPKSVMAINSDGDILVKRWWHEKRIE